MTIACRKFNENNQRYERRKDQLFLSGNSGDLPDPLYEFAESRRKDDRNIYISNSHVGDSSDGIVSSLLREDRYLIIRFPTMAIDLSLLHKFQNFIQSNKPSIQRLKEIRQADL